MAEYADSQLGSDEKIRREKLKKMLESMDSEKLAKVQDFVMNQAGPGQYAISGDYDPQAVEGYSDYGFSSGDANPRAYAEGLIASANTNRETPPAEFWYQGKMYKLSYRMVESSQQAGKTPPPRGGGKTPPPKGGGKTGGQAIPTQEPTRMEAQLINVETIEF